MDFNHCHKANYFDTSALVKLVADEHSEERGRDALRKYYSLSLVFPLTTHYSLLTVSPHFSTHFHSRDKAINPRSTPSNLSTSIYLIRIHALRSNKHPVN